MLNYLRVNLRFMGANCSGKTGRILRVIDVLVDIDEQRFALSKRTILETGLIRAARS